MVCFFIFSCREELNVIYVVCCCCHELADLFMAGSPFSNHTFLASVAKVKGLRGGGGGEIFPCFSRWNTLQSSTNE